MAYKSIQIPYKPLTVGIEKTDILFYNNFEYLIDTIVSDSNKKVYIVDETVSELASVKKILSSIGNGSIIVKLKAGETYKTIDSVLQIIAAALDADMLRSSTFVGIGGGVICDMSAFASSIFKRGAKLELIPTTLLAMVDAAIGGKTGCDFANYKNMIGSFYPASTIHFCAEFVQSQSEKEFFSGLAEVVKTAMLYDKTMYELLKTQKDAVCCRDKILMSEIIYRCAQAKALVVEEDLTEKNIRMQLNLGHTFGHALESLAGLGSITHGEAVAWGMARSLDASYYLGLCSASYRKEVIELLEAYGWCTAIEHSCLQGVEDYKTKLLKAMKKDKKNSSSTVRFVLQANLCDTIIREIDDKEVLAILDAKKVCNIGNF